VHLNDRLVKKVTDMKALISLTLLTFVLLANVNGQNHSFTVMFYNTENLFDAVDDTLNDDSEFLPGGLRHWNSYRYINKLDCISKVIVAAGEWEAPAVVGLCEVENEHVVKDLARNQLLEGIGYSYIHYDSPDKRGIDLCLLYRPDIVKVISHESWLPPAYITSDFNSRNVIFVKAEIFKDTLNFILCHWPSRRGGVMAADNQRTLIVETVINKIDSLRKTMTSGEKIILMGDLNSTPDFEMVKHTADKCRLINLSELPASKGKGSYRFNGKWEMTDQILVSENLCKSSPTRMSYNVTFAPLEKDFLLEDDPDYPGRRPFSTYRLYKWVGGFSDHLPVVLNLSQKTN
jgi:hypothetical protein